MVKIFKRIQCLLSGHRMKISDTVNERVNELCCVNCGCQSTETIYGEIVPLTNRYRKINESLKQLARKKPRYRRVA